MQLLRDVTTSSTSASEENYSYLQTVFCWGTFDGATATLQGSPDGTQWFDLVSFTDKNLVGIGLSVRYLRAVISNAGGATSLSLMVE